jgi:hypothetical protein
MKTHLMIGMALTLLVGVLVANGQDKAVDGIVAKNQAEVGKAKSLYEASVKRSNDAAVKALTNLVAARTKSKDTEGVARCQNAIATINGEEVEVAEVAEGNTTVPANFEFPKGTIKFGSFAFRVGG